MIIGNTFEETAYHEAGHIVAAAVLGLALRPAGITIVEVEDGVTTGLSCYWEDDAGYEKTLIALRAGEWAQQRQFPQSCVVGSLEDTRKFCEIVRIHFENRRHEVEARTYSQFDELIKTHWDAVTAVVTALSDSPWLPAEPGDHVMGKRKKRLDGGTLAGILAKFDISAQVRDTPLTDLRKE